MNADMDKAIAEALQTLERLKKARDELWQVNDNLNALNAHIRRYNVKHHSQSPVRLVKGNGEY
jgi:hypothetical protein